MGAGPTAKRRRTGTDSSANSVTPARSKPSGTGRGRGRPPNAPRDGRERPTPLAECFRRRCSDVLDRLSKKDHYNIFLEPVNTDDVAGYAETISRPMDFTTMRTKLSRQVYKSLGEFRKDLDLIWSNCLLFNGKEPTNVFSKKAIELRRLTEKLIVTTRQYLEKDKENLLRWKEKHRRRKETMQANAANANASLLGTSMGLSSSLVGRDARAQAHVSSRDPMDTTADEYAATERNGRTPQQNALAESLRLQYAGTTGLYKKNAVNAAFPQYTNPDGSVVQIPIRRYHPREDHWQTKAPGRVDVSRHVSAAPMFCDALPPSRVKNPCRPRPDCDSMLVKDYADSLYNFVNKTGSIANEIVTELLSPELTIKKTQEDWLSKGFNLKDLANHARLDALRKAEQAKRSENRWDAEAICKLADEIERTNDKVVSMLPHLSRTINELDGISGLRQFMDERLVKEVDEVPKQIVDYAMPHGVSASTVAEICKLQNVPGIRVSQEDLQCIAALQKSAEDHIANIGPVAGANLTGASTLTTSQLHEIQLRHLAIRQQRWSEAVKYAKALRGDVDGSVWKKPEQIAPIRERKPELSVVNDVGQVAQAVQLGREAATPSYALRGAGDMAVGSNSQSQSFAQTPEGAHAAGPGGSHQAGIPAGSQGYAGGRAAANELPTHDTNVLCKNCGARSTPGWNLSGIGPDKLQRLCVPCGIYYQKTRQHRPRDLWDQTAQRKGRPAPLAPTGNGVITSRSGSTGPHVSAPQSTPNGSGKRSSQKVGKAARSSARRSPSSSSSRGKMASARLSPPATGVRPRGVHTSSPPTAVPTSFMAASPHRAPDPMSNVAHLFTNQRSGADSRQLAAARNVHHFQPVHRPIGGSPFGNGDDPMVTASAGAQRQLQAGVDSSVYNEASNLRSVMPLQHLGAAGAHGQPQRQAPNYAGMQNQQYVQQKPATQNHLVASMAAGGAPMTSFSPYSQSGKDNSTMLGTNEQIGQHVNANSHLNILQQVEHHKPARNNPNGDVQMAGDHRGNQIFAPDASLLAHGTGGGRIGHGQFMNAGGVGTGMGSSFADAGNSSGGNDDVVGSDPTVDDILFPDGALEAPSGSPHFDF